MTERKYLFDVPYYIETKYDSHLIYKLCCLIIKFPVENLTDESEHELLSKYSDYIKYRIKEEYSIKYYGRSCYEKLKWYQCKIEPISVTNFRPFNCKTGIEEDGVKTHIIIEIDLSDINSFDVE